MCAPMLGAVAGIAGAVVQGIGAKQQAEGQAQQAEYNAKVEKINARTSVQQGLAKQNQIGAEYDKLRGQQTAAYAASGVDPTKGSAAIVTQEETARNEWMDSMNTIWSAETEQIGHLNKAKDLETQAANYRKAGQISMASALVGGIGSAAGGLGGGGGGFSFGLGA